MITRGGRPVVGFGDPPPCPPCSSNVPSGIAVAGLILGVLSLGITLVRINRPA